MPNTESDNYLDLVSECRKNLEICQDAESEWREESDKCNKFRALDQWDQQVLTQRGNQRPSLVIDQLGQYIDQLIGDWRRNRLGITVSPGESPADDETAEVIEGLIRQIEYQSKAYVAYDHAFDQMVGANRGYFRITTERRKGSKKQDIRIKRIPNADCVYLDPFCTEIDYSDMRFAIVVDTISLAAFKQKYGEKTSIQDFDACQKNYPSWFPNAESIVLAEYWKVEEEPRKFQVLTKPIAVTRNNRVIQTDEVYSDEWRPDDPQFAGVEVAVDSDGERMEYDEPKRVVCQYVLNGVEVLEKTRWIGSYIPIIPMMGREVYVENRRKLFSLISRSIDAQRLFNYSQSSMAERLGQAVRSPVVGATGQFKTQRQAWQDANVKPVAFLEYDPVDINGTLVGPPQRADFDPRIDQMVNGSLITKDNIKGTMGMYGSSLGQEDPKAKSGIAIKALQQEGDNATYVFLDNGARAIELAGCQIVDLIPKVYTQADIVQIRDAQNQLRAVAINQPIANMQKPPDKQKQDVYVNLETARYHVAIGAGPSHATKRQEEAQFATEFFNALPDPEKVKVAPVMLRHQDSSVAKEMADVLDPPKEDPNIPAMVEQMQMSQKLIQELVKEVNGLKDTLDSKKMEIDSKEKIAALNVLKDIRIAEVSASKDADNVGANILAAHVEQILDQAHEMTMANVQHGHAMEQADQSSQNAMAQQENQAALQPERTEGD